jgi:hypothetical protein
MRLVEINGQPGGLLVGPDDVPVAAVALDIADDQVQTVRAVSNPEKLELLRSVAGAPHDRLLPVTLAVTPASRLTAGGRTVYG